MNLNKFSIIFTLIGISSLTIANSYNAIITNEHNKYKEEPEITQPTTPDVAESCSVIMNNGQSIGDGIYRLISSDLQEYDAYCDMTTKGGGWTLILSENGGQSSLDQFNYLSSGVPLEDDYRSSLYTQKLPFEEILWFNHPNNEWAHFEHFTNTPYTINQIPITENTSIVYKAIDGKIKTTNSYYNLIKCEVWGGTASPFLMLSGSDEIGDDKGGVDTLKSCGSWESDIDSWYYRFPGGLEGKSDYSGNPWGENGHNPNIPTSKLQSFFIR